jgi:hypothetical protein
MGESLPFRRFKLFEAVEIELANKTLKLLMAKVEGQDFLLHFGGIENFYNRVFVRPSDNSLIGRVLGNDGCT